MVEISSYYYFQSSILRNDITCSSNLFYTRRDIQLVMSRLIVSFLVIEGNGNVCAKALAHWGWTLDSMKDFCFSNLPLLIRGLLYLDKPCVPYVNS